MDGTESCPKKLRPAIILWIFAFFCGSVLLFIDYHLPYREVHFNMKLIYPLKRMKNPVEETLQGYIVKTPGCRIPDMDPFDPTVKQYIFKERPLKCNATLPPLVEANLTSLSVIKSSLEAYKIEYLDVFMCCYFEFKRYDPNEHEQDDATITNNACVKFKNTVLVKEEFVKVMCFYNGSEIYTDYFCFVPPKFEVINDKIQDPVRKPLNVLIVGLDGVSRLNLHRQMPKTIDVLKDELKGVEFFGYNKIGDNTFPNLIAMLTGLSEEELTQVCWPNSKSHFDNCPFIWKRYKQRNFVTSFAEDASWMGVFNFQKRGFKKQPTDYYWRTFSFIADVKIGNQMVVNNNLCLGARMEYKILLNYTQNFVDSMRMYKKVFFGFIWSAGLSHDYLNYPGLGDSDFAQFFKYLQRTGALNRTVLIFLSDHGIRWSGIRTTNQGMLEERLPFLFVVLPEWYKKEFPMLNANLQENSRRLTTPYDLHYTLRDLLDPYKLTPEFLKNREKMRDDKSRSYSLFDSIPNTRTCDLANISAHWCACQEHIEVEVNSTKVVEVTEFTVAYLNKKISEFKECQNLTLNKIISARVSFSGNATNLGEGAKIDFTVSFMTVPGHAIFESTVRQTFSRENKRGKASSYNLKVMGTVSRLNLYGSQSACVSDFHMKLYCYCDT